MQKARIRILGRGLIARQEEFDLPSAVLYDKGVLDFGWLGKHTLFRRPFGWFMRLLGGIAIDREDADWERIHAFYEPHLARRGRRLRR
jgi:1-acyl-sn-glycerol-3-phosphate acyltransferase